MEISDELSRESTPSFMRVPEYLSVKEAAALVGVSTRSIYNYIKSGKLPGARIGRVLVLEAEHVRNYKRKVPGRLCSKIPAWHPPPSNNHQYLTSITVCVRQGQDEKLCQKLNEIRTAGKHLLPGTVARYIVRSSINPVEVQIVLVWRSTSMPPTEERDVALAALRADLAEVLAWETALYKECRIVLHA